jgi:hypothetical protein
LVVPSHKINDGEPNESWYHIVKEVRERGEKRGDPQNRKVKNNLTPGKRFELLRCRAPSVFKTDAFPG